MWNTASENATSAADWWMLVAELHVMLNDLNEQGFQGYYTMTGPATGPWTFGGFFMAYDKSNSTVQENLAPFTSKLDDLQNLASVTSWNVTKYATWIEAYNSLPKQAADTSDGPGGVVSVTRLLQRDDLSTNLDVSAKMFASIGPQAEEAQVLIHVPYTSPPLLKLSHTDGHLQPHHGRKHDRQLHAHKQRFEPRMAHHSRPHDCQSVVDRKSFTRTGPPHPELHDE
jgi:hypothetical protein